MIIIFVCAHIEFGLYTFQTFFRHNKTIIESDTECRTLNNSNEQNSVCSKRQGFLLRKWNRFCFAQNLNCFDYSTHFFFFVTDAFVFMPNYRITLKKKVHSAIKSK